ncbi:MAG TPA: putative 2OG-Fe(II) oxygenase [Allosphingosinicella sp.]|jgi:hypothetical protein
MAESAALARPEAPALQLVWAEALEAIGEQERALSLLASACERFPGDQAVHSGYAGALLRAGRIDPALEQVGPWLPRLWAQKLQLRLLIRAGRAERAAELESALAQADPADPDLLDYRASKLRGSPEALLSACDEALEHCPEAMHVLYHKALALAGLGRSQEAAGLMGLDRLLRIVHLDAPPPFDGLDGFNADLRREIEANPTLHSDPAGHATRKGRRTMTFPLPGDQAGTALIGVIREKVTEYSAGLTGEHPFVATRPGLATLKCWALIFDASGHQALHHHPGPWLTGVYYVAAPRGRHRPGALRIGSVPAWFGRPPPWKVIDVAPEPGTLVLFPSFVPHETLPTGSHETRISVAFDVAASNR